MEKKGRSKCIIDEVISCRNAAIINFEEGVLLKNGANKLKCKLIDTSNDSEESSSSIQQTMVLMGDDNEKFIGKLVPPDKSNCLSLIMIRDKQTNKAQLIQVSQYNTSKYIQEKENSESENDSIDDKYETKRDNLYKTFGSKKSLRMMYMGSKTKVNKEATNKKIDKTASEITVDIEDLKDLNGDNVDYYLPKCDREAINPEGVYKLTSMLSAEELESLDEVADHVLSDPPLESPEGSEFSPFFVMALKYLGSNHNSMQIKCLLFADAILYFLKLHMDKLRKKKISSTVCPFSKNVSRKILEEFTVVTEVERLRPEQAIDKAICWFLISTLIACKFSLDTALVCPYLLNKKLDLPRFEKILKVIGLSPLGSGIWTLKAPLTSFSPRKLKKFKRSR
uniref:DNA-directed RNA polymerase I subunit RPA49 n=2 Tax=Clastoptera arizonana TaxID=38151 RepID=A0A1B6C0N5_9HEMI